ncbi:MAG TPA: thioredoxin domain-containing protein [Candidatus Hydrogenedentes bacterium]|nr:thioredoxin domain-containing protein [Candidatus Hydrogenedentota bacterium]
MGEVVGEAAAQHTNRLAGETSPYLLQHAHNPVDWHAWGEEALRRAKEEDKPIFLSIGYSACHWCHVMERESFENESIAAFLNKHFVSIKVDREERPDLDEIYMAAVQALTGRGGWPLSVFLTPDLEPFYGGTYFPPEDTRGYPGFRSVLESVAGAWRERRDDIDKSAARLAKHLRTQMAEVRASGETLTNASMAEAAAELERDFDAAYGGFGEAPKFPPSFAIALLLRQYLHTGIDGLVEMAALTLDRMARGGMYDHLGGGFHRYSVDARWLVPHFEKMLYDNAQLAQVYLEAYQLTRKPLYRRVAAEILDYVLRDMTDKRGGFYSTEDADSEGREGAFYLWRQQEILDVLRDEAGYLFCQVYNVRPNGNFDSHEGYHKGLNILHIEKPLDVIAGGLGIDRHELHGKLAESRQELLAARERRVRPLRDDKMLASWNGLMISAFAQGHQVLGDKRYRSAAERAAGFVLENMIQDGRLFHTYRNGEARVPAYLDDHAFLIVALVDLYETTFDTKWLSAADALAQKMIADFYDAERGGFFFTSHEHKDLIARTKPTYDGAEPSGNAMAAIGLTRLGRLTDNREYLAKAKDTLEFNHANMMATPRAFMKMIVAADLLLTPPIEIAITGAPDAPEVDAFIRVLHEKFIPSRMVAVIDPASTDPKLAGQVPLLAGKTLVAGKAAAYVCENFTCKVPVTTPEALSEALGATMEDDDA